MKFGGRYVADSFVKGMGGLSPGNATGGPLGETLQGKIHSQEKPFKARHASWKSPLDKATQT